MKLKRFGSALLAVAMIFSSSALVTANAQVTGSISSYAKGDVDFDKTVTPMDIAKLQEYLFGDYDPGCSEEEFLRIADINSDGIIDWDDEHAFGYAYIHAYSERNEGDVNFDGSVTIDDATDAQKYLAGIIPEFEVLNYLCADMDKDGVVNIDDVTRIQKELV